MRIVFLGTPDFAVASLQKLLSANFHVVAVVTAPDKIAGRGLQLQKSPVKIFAEEQKIPVLQPHNLKEPQFVEILKTFNADLQIVVAFRMLPEIIWNMPLLGTINVHASLLPYYRGAAPINWAIINGETTTGVTTFKLKHKIDTGNILLQKKIDILSQETMGQLYERLKNLGAELLIETLCRLQKNSIIECPQNFDKEYSEAPKILKHHCQINWSLSGIAIQNLIRGLCPLPAAFFIHKDKYFKVFKADYEIITHNHAYGTIISDNKTYIKVACKDGFVKIKELQMENKKRMDVVDFLKGHRL